MPRGTQISENERTQALALQTAGKNTLDIARQLNRPSKVINNYLRDPDSYAKQNHRKNRRKMTVRDERRLLRAASNQPLSSRGLRRDALQLPISVRRTRTYLTGSVRLWYRKVKHVPPLTERHKLAHIKWSRENAQMGQNVWGSVFFADEKRFNCEGSDGLQYYWHDLIKEEQVLSKPQHGGNGVRVWAGFCSHSKTKLIKKEGRLNATN